MKKGAGRSSGRSAQVGEARANTAVQKIAENLSSNTEAEATLARLEKLANAAARDELAVPALHTEALAAVRGRWGAEISLLLHQENEARSAKRCASLLRG